MISLLKNCNPFPNLPIAYLFAFLLISPAATQAAPPTEYEVKAAFIHNIAKYVEWPPTPEYAASTMRLCVLGQNPFGNALDTLRNKKVGGLTWELVPVGPKTSMKECRVLFIAASESGNLRQILDSIKGSAVLTIGDTEGYAERGVMANFYLENSMVRIEINMDAAKRAGLNISSQLLKLARIVNESGGMR